MNHVDIILAIPLAIGAIRGFARGFVLEIASLVGLVAGVFIAALFADITGKIILGMVDWNPGAVKIIAFAITFLLVIIVVHMVARVIEKLFKMTGLNILNRLAGIGAGIIKVAFILSVVLVFFNHLNRFGNLMSEETQNESYLYEKVAGLVYTVLPAKDYIVVKETVNRITFGSEEE